MEHPFYSDVLVIDDADATRVVLCDMLKELGFTACVEARDGREALSKLGNAGVQLILCDNIMEGMTGLEFLRELRATPQHATTPVIFVSAVGAVSTVEEAISQGASDYLVKPVSFRKLRRKVEEVLRRVGGGSEQPPVWEINL